MAASVPSAPFTPDLLDRFLVPAGCQFDSLDAIEQLCHRSLLTVLAGGADRDMVVDIEATRFDPSDWIVKVGSLTPG